MIKADFIRDLSFFFSSPSPDSDIDSPRVSNNKLEFIDIFRWNIENIVNYIELFKLNEEDTQFMVNFVECEELNGRELCSDNYAVNKKDEFYERIKEYEDDYIRYMNGNGGVGYDLKGILWGMIGSIRKTGRLVRDEFEKDLSELKTNHRISLEN